MTPKVRIAAPKGRPLQLRYTDPATSKEVRISTGTRNHAEAESQRRELEARLLLGIKPELKVSYGPQMPWILFREEYRRRYLNTLRSASDAESRLDVMERILNPTLLSDVANRDALENLQSRLLAGECRKLKTIIKCEPGKKQRKVKVPDNRPRSPHTVRTSMAVVISALNWACECGWLEYVPKIRKVKTAKLRAAKGRPITSDEFQRMLNYTAIVVGKSSAESWRFLLRGLWNSGLRLEELMNVSWTDDSAIRPIWEWVEYPVLQIPAEMQKNETEETIPLLSWFESLLLEVPEERRLGYVFNPKPVHHPCNRPSGVSRLQTNWVGKVITRIGTKAGIVVHAGSKQTGRKPKFASAHDLRRGCAQRLVDSGVPERLVQRIMRHQSIETTKRHYVTGNIQQEAKELRMYLGTENP